MQMRILSGADVRAAVDMDAAIDAMAHAFAALSAGSAEVPVRLPLETDDGVTLFMPAHLREGGATGAKIVSVNPGNGALGIPTIHAVVVVLDAATGRARALMDGTWLTALRTGAVGGLAAQLLARKDAQVVAVFGAGVQARTQLEAVRCVRDITEVRVVSRSGDSADAFVAELEGVDARRVDDPSAAVAGADVVVAATDSLTPVFEGSRIERGTHVTAVGSFTPEMREVDVELLLKARVVVDQREAVLEEAGDIIAPLRAGLIDESVMDAEIGEIVLGHKPPRTSDDEITFFKSVGNAVQDVVVAERVLAVAEREGLGTLVDL